MRETLANSMVLLRYGWRSAWEALFPKQQSPALRLLMMCTFSYLPFLYFYQNYRTFKRLGESESLNQLLTLWKLPPAALTESAPLWAGTPHIISLGIGAMLVAILLGAIPGVFLMSHRKEPDTELEWLQTFPITMRSVLWGWLLQSTLIQPYLILLILPFLFSFVMVRGHHVAFSLVNASLLGWIAMFAASSLGRLLHYFVSFRLTPSRQRDSRVLVVFLMTAAFFLIYFPFIMNEGVYWHTIFRLAPILQSSGIADGMAVLLSGDASSLIPLIILFGAALVLAQGSVLISERLVARGPAAPKPTNKKDSRFLEALLDILSPVLRREIRIYLRDRSQWASMMAGPLFALGFFIWSSVGDSGPSQGKNLLLLCVILYLMIMGLGLQALSQRERPGLWFYAATPMRLSEVLREQRKVPFVMFGLMFGTALVVFVPVHAWLDTGFMSRVALSIPFVFTCERHYRSVALRSYSPAESAASKPLLLSIWLALTPAFIMIVFEGDPWNVGAFLNLFAALTFSYEKKVLALEDELMDPSYRITPKADLAQGLAAALFYTFALIISNAVAHFFRLDLSVQFLIAAATLWTLHYYYSTREVKDVPNYFGNVRLLDLLFLGLMGGFLLRAAGFWDRLTNDSAFLQHIYDLKDYPEAPLAAVMLFVVIARSVTEELIFRGLIQRGLSSRMAWPLALVTSAGLTTLCHKPQDFGPIFLTSLGAGLLYHRTQVLWPGILLTIAVQSLRVFGS